MYKFIFSFSFICIYFTFTEVVNTLISKGIVVPLPRELSLDQTFGGQRLHSLDDFEIRDINFGVLGSIVILGSTKGTIYIKNVSVVHNDVNASPTFEESRVDGLSILFGNKHVGSIINVNDSELIYIFPFSAASKMSILS
jgi:hypothetical protein